MTTRFRHHGFTLGETLAALAVAGIGVTLAVPGVQSLAARNRQATAVNQLVATLHRARSEAVMRNRPVAVCASTDGESCAGERWEGGWIAFVDADVDGARAGGEPLLERAAALPGLALRSEAFAGGVGYAPNGRATGPGTGEFVFCEPGAEVASRVVFVRASGLPVLHAGNGLASRCDTP